MRPRVSPRATLRHWGRAGGAVWGTSLRRCSGPVSTRGRSRVRCPPAAQVRRVRLPWGAPAMPPGRSPCPRPLVGVSFAVSESQRPDDLVCFVQRRRSGACLAWCRGFRHCCVAVSKSRGWGADVPWLVHWCAGALLGVGVVDGHPRGGAFQRCEGRLVLGAVPLPVARPPERAARVP